MLIFNPHQSDLSIKDQKSADRTLARVHILGADQTKRKAGFRDKIGLLEHLHTEKRINFLVINLMCL